MRIVIKRTGGYAGVATVADVDTSRLDAARAQRVVQLAHDALAEPGTEGEVVGADLMRYEITVEEDGATRMLTFTDDGRADRGTAVRRLIEELEGS